MFDIKKALEFYNIDEPEYYEKCKVTANTVENNPEYLKVYEKFSSITVGLSREERAKYHISDEKLKIFGFDIPNFTNLILLSGFEYHNRFMLENNYEQSQTEAQKNRLKAILHTGDKNGISVIQLFWGANFQNGEIIELGRLQYQNKKNKIAIHIPSGCPLTHESVVASLDKSKEKIKYYFSLENVDYTCSSWLLSPELDFVLPEKSNIRDFRKLFTIKEGKENLASVVSSVFHSPIPEDYNILPEKTTLQKNIKKYLLDKKIFHNGIGTLNYFEEK